MLCELQEDPFQEGRKKLRRNTASSRSGPKCRVIDVELATLEPDGLMSNVCVAPTSEGRWEDKHFNSMEAVPECMLEPGSRRWRALLGNCLLYTSPSPRD
eukprot:13223423-Alexandrium_andersonii.AAC.1